MDGEPIIHAVADSSRSVLVGITSGHLFTVDMEERQDQASSAKCPASGRIAVGSKGGIFGQDGPAHLWRYDVAGGKLERKAVALPEGAWGKAPLTWAKDHHSGTALYRRRRRQALFPG